MFYYTASLQFAQKTATTFDLAHTAAISGHYWTAISLIKITLWLIDTTLQYMDRDAHLITLSAFAQAHTPLPEFPAAPSCCCPASVALNGALSDLSSSGGAVGSCF
jgi:hypothetical protein